MWREPWKRDPVVNEQWYLCAFANRKKEAVRILLHLNIFLCWIPKVRFYEFHNFCVWKSLLYSNNAEGNTWSTCCNKQTIVSIRVALSCTVSQSKMSKIISMSCPLVSVGGLDFSCAISHIFRCQQSIKLHCTICQVGYIMDDNQLASGKSEEAVWYSRTYIFTLMKLGSGRIDI